jgi:hypothetical protein
MYELAMNGATAFGFQRCLETLQDGGYGVTQGEAGIRTN